VANEFRIQSFHAPERVLTDQDYIWPGAVSSMLKARIIEE